MATAGVEATEAEGKNMQTETHWVGDSDNTSGVNTRKRSRREGGSQRPSQDKGVGGTAGEENRRSDTLKV